MLGSGRFPRAANFEVLDFTYNTSPASTASLWPRTFSKKAKDGSDWRLTDSRPLVCSNSDMVPLRFSTRAASSAIGPPTRRLLVHLGLLQPLYLVIPWARRESDEVRKRQVMSWSQANTTPISHTIGSCAEQITRHLLRAIWGVGA